MIISLVRLRDAVARKLNPEEKISLLTGQASHTVRGTGFASVVVVLAGE